MLVAALICSAFSIHADAGPRITQAQAAANLAKLLEDAKRARGEYVSGTAYSDTYDAELAKEEARSERFAAEQENRRIRFEMERQRQEMEAIRREQQRQIDAENAAYNSARLRR